VNFDRKYKDGTLTIRVSTWDEIYDIVNIFVENNADYIWRGHQLEKWELISSVDRDINECAKHSYYE